MQDKLARAYGYDPVYIKLSSIIKEHACDVGETIPDGALSIDAIDKFQSVGNKLREEFGDSYLADRAIEKIAYERDQRGGYAKINDRRVVKPVKRACPSSDNLRHMAV